MPCALSCAVVQVLRGGAVLHESCSRKGSATPLGWTVFFASGLQAVLQKNHTLQETA
jgi:hypothetical protein